jgi:uncharacterized SAM-binding protein YcdF (DUF218 family)
MPKGVFMQLTQDRVAQIASYLELKTYLPECVDLIFVFGTRALQPAHIAAKLYHQGVSQRILVTGGANRYTGINEAEAHRAVLVGEGIPSEAILVENQSTNTLENVQFSRQLIAPFERDIKTVLAVAKWQHSRRAVMTLKANFPVGIRYFVQTYELPDSPRAGWHLEEESRRRVLRNWENIPTYLERGHLAEIIEHENGYI